MSEEITIERAIQKLIYKRCFYATVASGIARRPVDGAICNTMAVCVNPETHIGVELIYNPEWVTKISKNEMDFQFVIEHEMVHLICKHPQRFWASRKFGEIPHKTFNVAADIATNELIIKQLKDPEPLKERISPWLAQMEKSHKFPKERSMEEYIMLLEKNPWDENAGSLVTQHMWDKRLSSDGQSLNDATQKEQNTAKTKNEINLPDYIQDCVNQYQKDCGNVPAAVQSLLDKLIPPDTTPPWEDLLHGHVMTGMPAKPVPSAMRFSRRKWGFPKRMAKIPGTKVDRYYKVLALIDQSGSMSKDLIMRGLGITWSIKEYEKNIELWIGEHDTSLSRLYKVDNFEDIKLERTRYGGTDFIKPLAEVEEQLKPDICIMYTDGCGRAPVMAPRFSVIWALTVTPYFKGKAPANWGKVLEVSSSDS